MKNWFLQRREELDLTQEQAAAVCLTTLGTWRNWEKCRACPALSAFPKIASGLRWELSDVQIAVGQIQTEILKRKWKGRAA